jgi:hypothetical protein
MPDRGFYNRVDFLVDKDHNPPNIAWGRASSRRSLLLKSPAIRPSALIPASYETKVGI